MIPLTKMTKRMMKSNIREFHKLTTYPHTNPLTTIDAGEEVGFRLPKKIIRSSDIIQAAGKKTKKAKRYVRIGDESKEGTGETLLITNFEVEEQQNAIEVRNGVKIYGTGIRGLRTLRENRDDDDEEEKDAETLKREYIELKGDKFKRFQ
ncbi:unnamed protein product [Moneuplotes crassus]|uniref:Uncharacterized protein n=1 Tax=Euplotes crassus TaxID=5936 RepID=A0AAD2CZM9_EUPCR|nr:unnamed protein product [Moneuplotes crassus]